ncbi:NUDIX domain-containing protein [Sutcliffiella rhizosphaerae]|uniref:Nudix hydrolase domain-containing protein n=1 Tax=Sutcliffiella rhizosphaerae TaxID=2880967 RepID=A0ABN8ADQ2_9BACI|nr:NUDIX domain-containing protein [Sutcliffiella rhizosphaerae]CAG9622391.1 hypothetical protein BACCIP111883_03182 [Sutcliffiella rhizosphaerae]
MSYPIRVKACALIIKEESILLIEFNDQNGLHYNFPSGGVEAGESIMEGVKREAWEEACIEVDVGPLALVYEYAPHQNNFKYGETPTLALLFECEIKKGSTPKMPSKPDLNQTGVKWIKLSELHSIVLYPNIRDEIIAYAINKRNIEWIEESRLEGY